MKKMLSILASISLGLVSSTSVISCASETDAGGGYYNFQTIRPENYKDWENSYQYGPDGSLGFKEKSESKNKNIDYFFGDSKYNYVNYIVLNSGEKIFNGDWNNFKKTKTNNFKKILWKNDFSSEKIILFKENGVNNITDLNVEVINDDNEIQVEANFLNPIKAKKQVYTSQNQALYNGTYISFDEVGKTNLKNMNYEAQPLLIKYKTSNLSNAGEKNIKIKISFKDEKGILSEFFISKKIEVKNKLNNKSYFGSDSMAFPTGSSKFLLKQLEKVISNKNIILSGEDETIEEIFNKTEKNNIIKNIIFRNNPLTPIDINIREVKLSSDGEKMVVYIDSPSYHISDKNHNKDENGKLIKDDYLSLIISNNKKKTFTDNESKNINNDLVKIIGGLEKNYNRVEKPEWSTPDFLTYDKKDNENRSLNNKWGKTFKKLNNELNAKYAYLPAFGLGYLKYIATIPNDKNLNDNNFLDYIKVKEDENNLSSLKIFNDENVKWSLEFTNFDKYIDFMIENGYKKVYIPIVPRGNNTFNFYYKNNEKDNNSKLLANIMVTKKFIDSKGNIDDNWKFFAEKIVALFSRELSKHIVDKKEKGKWSDFDFYYSFDETKESVNDFTQKIINENDIKMDLGSKREYVLKSHAYVGWEFYVKNYLNVEELEKHFNKYDDITLQQREYIANYEKSNEEKQSELKEYFEKRRKHNQETHFYSSWNNYPGGYIGTNGGDLVWDMLLADKYGADGFDRFQLDGFSEDFTLNKEVMKPKHEPGDEFYIYPGDDYQINESVRYNGMREGVNLVNKIQKLKEINSINGKYQKELDFINSVIFMTSDVYSDSKLKWYLDEIYNIDFNEITDIKKLTINEQISVIEKIIEQIEI